MQGVIAQYLLWFGACLTDTVTHVGILSKWLSGSFIIESRVLAEK